MFARCIGLVARMKSYQTQYGFWQMVLHAFTKPWDVLFNREFILYYSDLCDIRHAPEGGPSLRVDRYSEKEALEQDEYAELIKNHPRQIVDMQFRERFEKGASIWLLKENGQVAGFVWTIKGRTVRKHFFPIVSQDVHFFDNEVFPQYRSRGLNTTLIETVLWRCKEAGMVRAHIETPKKNRAERRSLAKTHFQDYGMAKKTCFLWPNLTLWKTTDIENR